MERDLAALVVGLAFHFWLGRCSSRLYFRSDPEAGGRCPLGLVLIFIATGLLYSFAFPEGWLKR